MAGEGNSYQTHKAFISVSGEKSGYGRLFILDFAFFFNFFFLFSFQHFLPGDFLKGQGRLAVFGSGAQWGRVPCGTFGPGASVPAEVPWHLKGLGRSWGPASGTPQGRVCGADPGTAGGAVLP